MTAAIDNDEKTHSAIKTKEAKHEVDPNDIVPVSEPPKNALKKETPKKIEILKDPKVEAKKANKTSPTELKLKADS